MLIQKLKQCLITAILPQKQYILWKMKRSFIHDVVEKHYPFIYDKETTATTNRPTAHTIIAMCNGFMRHGGLSDRFLGITSSFLYAKKNGVNFAISWTSPFNLQDYLVPNRYDWTIAPNNVIYNRPIACPICIGSIYKMCGTDKQKEEKTQQQLINSIIKKHPKAQQYHLYSNAHFATSQYHDLFNELFKPSPWLQQIINKHLTLLGENYTAMTFRFVHLLADFKDTTQATETLSANERQAYINDCINVIKQVHQRCNNSRILVTSDSETFLNEAKCLPYVYIADGKVAHIDNLTTTTGNNSADKEFADLFLLARAKKIYRVHKGKMYYSGFPLTAAMIGNTEVETIELT